MINSSSLYIFFPENGWPLSQPPDGLFNAFMHHNHLISHPQAPGIFNQSEMCHIRYNGTVSFDHATTLHKFKHFLEILITSQELL